MHSLYSSVQCVVSVLVQTQAEVKMLLSSRGITVEKRQFQSSHGPKAVEDIFVREKDMRVFILNMYSPFASQVLCKVRAMSMPLFI